MIDKQGVLRGSDPDIRSVGKRLPGSEAFLIKQLTPRGSYSLGLSGAPGATALKPFSASLGQRRIPAGYVYSLPVGWVFGEADKKYGGVPGLPDGIACSCFFLGIAGFRDIMNL